MNFVAFAAFLVSVFCFPSKLCNVLLRKTPQLKHKTFPEALKVFDGGENTRG
jgi:hypothetical protein